jgi:hypothetical protein
MAKNGATQMDKRVSIHIESRRYRLADPDGISAKAAIDGLVLGQILSDDSTKEIKEVSYSQIRIGKAAPEITIITID